MRTLREEHLGAHATPASLVEPVAVVPVKSIRATVEDQDGRVLGIVYVGEPDENDVCAVLLADQRGQQDTQMWAPHADNWVKLLYRALKAVR